jgi:hypothetical protein
LDWKKAILLSSDKLFKYYITLKRKNKH